MRTPRTTRKPLKPQKPRKPPTRATDASPLAAAVLTSTAEALAARLDEPNVTLVAHVIEVLGAERTLVLIEATLALEAVGGIQRKASAHRRTPGGAFFWLVRQTSSTTVRRRIFPEVPPPPGPREEVNTRPSLGADPVLATLETGSDKRDLTAATAHDHHHHQGEPNGQQ